MIECCCILSKFYIKPQPSLAIFGVRPSCILSKFYIKPQQFPCVLIDLLCCILSKFYIKPQRRVTESYVFVCCILSKFYIKPQPEVATKIKSQRCILSKFYIKPQLVRNSVRRSSVVSYRNSTSNHNRSAFAPALNPLYLIEILHQTTTTPTCQKFVTGLYLIEILHQTTTSGLILIDKVLLTGCLPL